MKRLKEDIVNFFQNQGFAIVTTVNKDGTLHSACKGIVKINRTPQVYLLDLYKQKTYDNLKHNHNICLTAVDEHRFKGYSLQGKARIVEANRLESRIIKAWEDKITSRLTTRVLRNVRGEKGHPKHPEVLLPKPEYLIVMQVREIIDLTPRHLK